MKSSTRIIVNTGALYFRSIINVVLGLYSSRLVLAALGANDFGIYSLIGGVIALLSFVTTTMTTTTQRFLSFYQGKEDISLVKTYFINSFWIHIFIDILLLIVLEIIGLFLFDGLLNIIPQKIHSAKIVYQCVIFMVLCSFISSPFKALLISHENLVYISLIEIFDGILKVVIAILLTYGPSDRLVFYAILMCSLSLSQLIAYSIFCFLKYKECVCPKLSYLSKTILRQLSSFAGWTLYSTGCIVGRLQGVTIIINKFLGTVANSAFGLALQINSALSFISSSLLSAIRPQIIKSEGNGNREQGILLAMTASKASYLLLSLVIAPVLIYTDQILNIWLEKVPENTVLFCRVMLITSLADSITIGLGIINDAIGKIKNYSLLINTIKLLTVPILLVLLLFKIKIEVAIWTFAFLELIAALIRIPYIHVTAGLNGVAFLKNVIIRVLIPTIIIYTCYFILKSEESFVLIFFTSIIISLIYLISIYFISLNKLEKKYFLTMIKFFKKDK